MWGCHVLFTNKWFLSGYHTTQACLVDCCRDGCPSGRFSSLHWGTLKLWQFDHWVLSHLTDKGPTPWSLSWDGQPAFPLLQLAGGWSSHLHKRMESNTHISPSNTQRKQPEEHPQEKQKKKRLQKTRVMWSKANDKRTWRSFETGIVPILQNSLKRQYHIEGQALRVQHIWGGGKKVWRNEWMLGWSRMGEVSIKSINWWRNVALCKRSGGKLKKRRRKG